MEEEKRQTGPHWAGVLGGSLLAVLLLYIASPIPVSFAINRYHLGIPPAVPRFYHPIVWTGEHTPLKEPIHHYEQFVSGLGR